jgi:hypothetical protein
MESWHDLAKKQPFTGDLVDINVSIGFRTESHIGVKVVSFDYNSFTIEKNGELIYIDYRGNIEWKKAKF